MVSVAIIVVQDSNNTCSKYIDITVEISKKLNSIDILLMVMK